MELKQLRYFIEAAEREHISHAALELDVAQSAISRQIARLETELNTQLFIREGRNIRLTAEGETLLVRARHLMQYMNETKEVITQQTDAQEQQIYLGYSECYLSQTLTSILRSYNQEADHPLIATIDEEQKLFQQLKSRQIDIMIAGQQNTDAAVTQIPLYEEHFCLLINSAHNMAMTQQPTIPQLKQLKLFVPKSYDHIMQALFRNAAMDDIYYFSSYDYAEYIVQHDNHAVIIPDYMAGALNHDKLTQISLHHLIKRNMMLYYQSANPKKQIAFTLQHLTKYLQKTTTYH